MSTSEIYNAIYADIKSMALDAYEYGARMAALDKDIRDYLASQDM